MVVVYCLGGKLFRPYVTSADKIEKSVLSAIVIGFWALLSLFTPV